MRGSDGEYNCGYTWKQALEFPAGANFAGVTKAFLLEYQWSQWIPDQSIIERGVGEGDSLKIAVSHSSGQMALVYFSNSSQARIKNTLNKVATAHWFDPREGQKKEAGSFQQNEVRDIIPPKQWEDAILVLQSGN